MKLIEYKPVTKGRWKLLIYAKESAQFPIEETMRISRAEIEVILSALSALFSVPTPIVKVTCRRGGAYQHKNKLIKIGPVGAHFHKNIFRYSVLVHEFAHHLADCRNRRRVGHTKKFWDALEDSYLAANIYMRNRK